MFRSVPRRLTAALLCLLLAPPLAAAESVTTRHDGRLLNGQLRPVGEQPLQGGVVLLVHGTKGHSGMPIIRKAAAGFKDAGLTTLAITLSLGRSDRTGFMPCNGVQDHRHADAVAEIGAWLDWLAAQGARRVALFGHSRGGNQVAWYAAERDDPRVAGLVMLAPMTWDAERAGARYRKRFGADLDALLGKAGAVAADTVLEVPGFLHCNEPTRVTAGAFLGYYGDDRRKDTPALLPDIGLPTLVAVGRDDGRVPDLAGRLQRLPSAAHREAMLLADTGHMFRDRVATVVDRAAAFLEKHAVFHQPRN